MALPVTDTFTTGSDQSLTSYSANWTMSRGVMKVFAATDDFSGDTSVDDSCGFHNVETYNNNQYSQVVISAISDSNFIGAACRCDAGVNYYGFYTGDTSDFLFKMVTGTYTQLGSSGGGSAVSDVIRVEAEGTTIRPKRNGSVPGTPGEQTDSALTSGNAGISAWHNASDARGDNFEGGNLGGVTLNVTISPATSSVQGVKVYTP